MPTSDPSASKSPRHQIPILILVLVIFVLTFLLLSSTGCAAWRAVVPGGVTPADAEFSGVKSGEPISLTAHLAKAVSQTEPRAQNIANLLSVLNIFGVDDPLGVLLPITLVGETNPRFVICERELVVKCKNIPLNAKVNFAGEAVGGGVLWRPKRLTADNFND